MSATLISIIAGLIIVAAITVTDIIFAADKASGNTYSEIIRHWGIHTAIVPYICGVLSGHFFHPGFKALFGQPYSISVAIWGLCAVGIISLALTHNNINLPLWIPFQIGFIAGILLWPV
jgi:hypothetical protein